MLGRPRARVRCLPRRAGRPLERDRRMLSGEHRQIHFRVTNLGDEEWPGLSDREPAIRIAYRWYSSKGELIVEEGERSQLPVAVRPEATVVVPVLVTAPQQPGELVLEVDLVHENVQWFGTGVRVRMEIMGADGVASEARASEATLP